MRYLHIEVDGLRLLLPATAVASTDAHTVRCTDGTVYQPGAVFGLVELSGDALAPAPWLPASAHRVDAVTVAPLAGRLAWRLRSGGSQQ